MGNISKTLSKIIATSGEGQVFHLVQQKIMQQRQQLSQTMIDQVLRITGHIIMEVILMELSK